MTVGFLVACGWLKDAVRMYEDKMHFCHFSPLPPVLELGDL